MSNQRAVETKKVEKAAVLAVQNLIQPCPTIDEKLDDDDKNILVDGSLELYSSPDMCIQNFIGKIDTQVKGTTKKLHVGRRGFVKFSVKTEDLRRYCDVFHGILFFYVSVRPKVYTAHTVYYAQLLPYDISLTLSEASPDQKTVSVRFKPFPTDPKEITRLLMAFHNNRELQLKAEVSAYGFFDEHSTLPQGIKSFKFSTQLFPGESPVALKSFREGPYIYGETEGGQLKVIGKMGDVSACAMGSTATISTGDFTAETTLMVGESEEGDFLEFEGVRINLSEGRSRLNYTVSGGARKRLSTARFVQQFAKSGTLLVNGTPILRSNDLTLDEDKRSRLDDEVQTYGSIVETLDTLHIDVDWDIAKLSRKEWNDLHLIHRLVIEKELLTNRELESPLVHFDIQGSRIYTLAAKRDDGSYEFSDLFSDGLFFAFGEPDETTGQLKHPSDPVGAFAALNEEGYRTIVNIDAAQIEESFERCPVTPGNQNPLNQKLLEMLAAYDKGCAQPKKLLAAATLLATKLYEADEASDTYYLNLMQTIRRARELTNAEKGRLRDIAIENSQYYMRAAAYALLGDKDMANSCLERCVAAERQQIESYPIARFFR